MLWTSVYKYLHVQVEVFHAEKCSSGFRLVKVKSNGGQKSRNHLCQIWIYKALLWHLYLYLNLKQWYWYAIIQIFIIFFKRKSSESRGFKSKQFYNNGGDCSRWGRGGGYFSCQREISLLGKASGREDDKWVLYRLLR